jgi:hypothetical protein
MSQNFFISLLISLMAYFTVGEANVSHANLISHAVVAKKSMMNFVQRTIGHTPWNYNNIFPGDNTVGPHHFLAIQAIVIRKVDAQEFPKLGSGKDGWSETLRIFRHAPLLHLGNLTVTPGLGPFALLREEDIGRDIKFSCCILSNVDKAQPKLNGHSSRYGPGNPYGRGNKTRSLSCEEVIPRQFGQGFGRFGLSDGSFRENFSLNRGGTHFIKLTASEKGRGNGADSDNNSGQSNQDVRDAAPYRNNFAFFWYMLASCAFFSIALIVIIVACHYQYTPFNAKTVKCVLFMVVVEISSIFIGVFLAWHGTDVWVNS